MQAQNRVANLYQTDLDRHLYAFEKREPVFAGLTNRAKGLVGEMARWRTALASYAFFL